MNPLSDNHSTIKVDSWAGPLNLEPIRPDNLYPVAEDYMAEHRHDRVIWTGEKRPPKAGEWFLSGSKIEGYRAITDGIQAQYIGRLIEGELAWRPKNIGERLMVDITDSRRASAPFAGEGNGSSCGQPGVAEIELCPRCGQDAAAHPQRTPSTEE